MPASLRLLLLAAALPLAAPLARAAEEAPGQATEAEIRRLMELTGAGTLGAQMAGQMLPALRKMVPEAPEAFWRKLEARFDAERLVTVIVPIYRKHLTSQDVKELVTFYESPVGKKLIRALPQIMQESMAAGQAWGQAIAREVIDEARAAGYTVKT